MSLARLAGSIAIRAFPIRHDRRRPVGATAAALMTAAALVGSAPLDLAKDRPARETREAEGLYPVQQHDRIGYIDRDGRIVINPQFEKAGPFSEGLAWIEIDRRFGFIDRSGKIVVNPQFESADGFSEGLARVEMGDKHGYIDRAGKIAITPQFDEAWSFSETLARVKVSRKYGFIGPDGKFAINPQFDEAWDFSEGLARIEIDDLLQGFVDPTGKIVIKAQFKYAGDFHDGLALVRVDSLFGYVDTTGGIAIRPQFKKASDFSAGLARMVMGNRVGLIDTKEPSSTRSSTARVSSTKGSPPSRSATATATSTTTGRSSSTRSSTTRGTSRGRHRAGPARARPLRLREQGRQVHLESVPVAAFLHSLAFDIVACRCPGRSSPAFVSGAFVDRCPPRARPPALRREHVVRRVALSPTRRIVFDAGSGLRDLGESLVLGSGGALQIDLFLTHYHYDHLQGLPFFSPLHRPGTTLTIRGHRPGGGNALPLGAFLERFMAPPLFPVALAETPGRVSAIEIGPRDVVRIDDVTISRAAQPPSRGDRVPRRARGRGAALPHRPRARRSGDRRGRPRPRRRGRERSSSTRTSHPSNTRPTEDGATARGAPQPKPRARPAPGASSSTTTTPPTPTTTWTASSPRPAPCSPRRTPPARAWRSTFRLECRLEAQFEGPGRADLADRLAEVERGDASLDRAGVEVVEEVEDLDKDVGVEASALAPAPSPLNDIGFQTRRSTWTKFGSLSVRPGQAVFPSAG